MISWLRTRVSIRIKFITFALIPVLVLFVAVLFYIYVTQSNTISRELTERSNLVASLIAKTSEFDVITGDRLAIAKTLSSVVRDDSTIAELVVLDARNNVISREVANRKLHSLRVFQVPIRQTLVDVNTFDSALAQESGKVIGYVRVSSSPEPVVETINKQALGGLLFMLGAALLSLWTGALLMHRELKPLVETIAALRKISHGDLSVDFDVTSEGDMGDLQRTIKQMINGLQETNTVLEVKVSNRTRELESARDQAIQSDKEVKQLIRKVNSAVEDERKLIATEIHDHLNAELIVARLSARRIFDLSAPNLPHSCAVQNSEIIRVEATTISEIITRLYKLSRDLVRRLRPEVIDTLGLVGALEDLASHYMDLNPSWRVSFSTDGECSSIIDTIAITVYRVAQEALANAYKHSRASHVVVSISRDDDQLKLIVSDDGCGFDISQRVGGIGLVGMRERVQSLNGRLGVISRTGCGTSVLATIPCPR